MSSPLGSLPAEVFGHVASCLATDHASLAPLAASSRQCQAHVEATTFKSLLVKPSELSDFHRIVDCHRFRVLRSLLYDAASVCQQQVNALTPSTRMDSGVLTTCSESFTTAIRDVLTTLDQKVRKDSSHRHPGISLSLATPTLPDNGSVETKEIFVAQRSPSADEQVTFDIAWLRLLPYMFPRDLAVSAVTRLRDSGVKGSTNGFWDISPASWVVSVAHLPCLMEVDLQLRDGGPKCKTSRKRARDAFGLSIPKFPESLRKLTITYTSSPPANQTSAPQDLRDPGLGYDIFSHELGLLGGRLARLELAQATLDLVAFFRMSAQDQCSCLEEVAFEGLQLASANGTWYFGLQHGTERPDVDEDAPTLDEMREYLEEDELPALEDHPLMFFRNTMDDAKFREIYVTAAAAAKQMPNLRELSINFDGLYKGDHNFLYARGPSQKFFATSPAEIKVAWDLRPVTDIDEQVKGAWEDVGKSYKASIQILKGDCNKDMWFRHVERYQTVM